MGLGSKYQVKKITLQEVPVLSSVRVVNATRVLGSVIDNRISMAVHVGLSEVRHGAYYQLRQLRLDSKPLTSDAARTLVQAFI
jgi:hypothetical protein